MHNMVSVRIGGWQQLEINAQGHDCLQNNTGQKPQSKSGSCFAAYTGIDNLFILESLLTK